MELSLSWMDATLVVVDVFIGRWSAMGSSWDWYFDPAAVICVSAAPIDCSIP